MTREQGDSLDLVTDLIVDHVESCEIEELEKIMLTIINNCKNHTCDFCSTLKTNMNIVLNKKN